ncbi:hypothetical protein ACH5RR_011137 [Cinchona calisaya]|uniref:Actin cross-linking n=1 Tax=Cinchona calisaya TaxID=153742 RepID=A0ABD3A6G6_9GENT
MEFFNKAEAVRIKSHLDKYLVAEDDEQTVRQSRNGSSKKARWTVEVVQGNSQLIRLKSCHGGYLTASDDPFLLGMTGKKVQQTIPESQKDPFTEWEPIKEGYKVKLRTKGGKFLRGNGAMPPWRNSITHDLPHRTATQDWILWEVEVVDISVVEFEHLQSCESSPLSSFSSLPADFSVSNDCSSSTPSPNYAASISSETRWPSIASNRSGIASSREGGSGMQFFDKAKSVRLQSHLVKYLVADDDEETVRQSRNGSSHKARWTVEFVEGKSHVIRLKSCHGLYLTATKEAFLLGATGKKVLQTLPKKMDTSIEWEPIKEGLYVKLRTSEGKFLRANGGPPPWRNSITHDIPHRTATQDWILWGVDIVDIALSDTETVSDSLSPASSFSSLQDDYSPSPDTGSPMAYYSRRNGNASKQSENGNASIKVGPGMEFFKKAKSVRLRSHHQKYLLADSDEEAVIQDRSGTSKLAKWTVEFVEGVENVVRLKSCYGKYLTASDEQYLLGVTGQKVTQSLPRKLDSKVEWEPIKDGFQIRLKTRYGNYLRANGGLPPWRNSITHDIPRTHQEWILWEVDVLEIRPDSPKKVTRSESLDEDLSSSSFHLRTPSQLESCDSFVGSPMKYEGRMIYYHVADDDGSVNDAIEGHSFHFKGRNVEELTQKLEEETGLENITVCSKNKINGKLYPLRLGLPPNNATMHVVVVPSTLS